MSSEQISSTSDLRSAAQDYKREAAQKHKWALGSVTPTGRTEDHPRPHRPSETYYNNNRRSVKGAVASLETGSKTKTSRKQDILDAADTYPISQNSSDESSASASADEDHEAPTAAPAGDEGVMYSFDAHHGPSQGSQILNVALAKAIEKYEDKETVKLVRKEYDMIDDDGESLGLSPVKKGKGKGKERSMVIVEDDDYEFV